MDDRLASTPLVLPIHLVLNMEEFICITLEMCQTVAQAFWASASCIDAISTEHIVDIVVGAATMVVVLVALSILDIGIGLA